MLKLPIALAAAAVLAVAPAAGASSIAYVKDGDVHLVSPDGRTGYRVTFDGGWASPSQADDGTLLAQKGTRFVRMDRSGTVLGTNQGLGGDVPLPAGLDTGDVQVVGPYDPKLSPDGTQIAYWFHVRGTGGGPDGHGSGAGAIDDWVTAEPVDRFVAGPETAVRGDSTPSWIDSHRLLTTSPWQLGGLSVSTWVAGGDFANEQWWFTDPNAILQDGELSPDRSKAVFAAATHGATSAFDGLRFYVTDGPAWTHEPPYENILGGDDFPAPPQPACQDTRASEVSSPTWAPDGTALAFRDADGISVEDVPADLGDCGGLTSRLLVPGGRDPDWGPADVDPRQAPAAVTPPPTTPTATPGPTAPAPTISDLRVRRGRVTFRLTAATPVRLRARRGRVVRRRTVAGHAGPNRCRLRLRRGRWTLTATAGPTRLSTRVRVR